MTKPARSHLLLAFTLLLLVACGPLQLDLEATATVQFATAEAMTTAAQPSRTPKPTGGPETATLWCPWCEEANMGIDLFSETRSGSEVVATLPHGTEVTILKVKVLSYWTWVRVQSEGVEGWVLIDYLKW